MPFPIAYLSDDIVIVVKPAGLSFHKGEEHPGFVQELRRSLEQQGSPILEQGRLYPVHRLDAVTSGLVVFARNKTMARELSEAFAGGQIEKRYVALAERKPSKKQGLIAGDMCRSRRGSWRLQRSKENPAKTRFCSTSLASRRPGLRLYLLRPMTGRTHQLRVAMKSLGAPILGDAMYGQSETASVSDRTYLHACALSFQIGAEQVQVIHQPDQGEEFCNETFKAAWTELGDVFTAL